MSAPVLGEKGHLWTLSDVDPVLLEAASGRPGTYRLECFVYDQYLNESSYVLSFTEKEWRELSHVGKHGEAADSKAKVVRSGLQQQAAKLWSGGDPESIAMLTLAPDSVYAHINRVVMKAEELGCLAWLGWGLMTNCCWCGRAPRWPRLTVVAGATQAPAGGKDRPTNSLGMPAPGLTPAENLIGDGGGLDAEDMQVRAERIGRLLISESQDFPAVVSCAPADAPARVVGVLVGPTINEPCVYNRCEANARLAVEHRIRRREKKAELTKLDFKALDDTVKRFIKECYSDDQMAAWVSSHPFEDLRSRKWTRERFDSCLDEVLEKANPEVRPELIVKVEGSTEGKAPRPLIDDKPAGQLMAVAAIACAEDLQWEVYKDETIKRVPKDDALVAVGTTLAHVGQKAEHEADLFEADGKAWDASCNPIVRGRIDNKVLDHVTQFLCRVQYMPHAMLAAHLRINMAEKLSLRGKRDKAETGPDGTAGGFYRETITAIRRSGHRGTSSLNWLINKILWLVAIYGKAAHLMAQPKQVGAHDRFGVFRRYKGVYEGDDGIMAASPRFTSAQFGELRAFWARAGFEMVTEVKNVGGDGAASFVGYVFRTTKSGLTIDFAPEIPRAFRAGTSVAAATLAAWKDGDKLTVARAAASAAVARARGFARRVPTLARRYLDYAESLIEEDYEVDRECKIVCAGIEEADKALSFQNVADEVRMLLGTDDQESAYLRAIGKSYTSSELASFLAHQWCPKTLRNWDDMKASLPASWQ